jgi:hypothetical protein
MIWGLRLTDRQIDRQGRIDKQADRKTIEEQFREEGERKATIY